MLSLLIKVALLCLLMVAFIFFFQRNLMYFPHYDHYSTKEIPENFKEVTIATEDDNRIKGWLHIKNIKTKKTVLYFHGNAGTINNRLQRIKEFAKMDINFMIISYHGYSKNSGTPTEKGLYDDGRSAVRFLIDKGANISDIFLYGESLGAAIAVETAQNNNFAGVILEAPFTSAIDVAKKIYPFLPVSFLLWDRYESYKKINKISSPILIFHGENDSVIPFKMGKKMFEIASEPKEMVSTKDGHTIQFSNQIISKIKKFILHSH